MKIVAIDMSTSMASLALLDEEYLVSETAWMEKRRGEQLFFTEVEAQLRTAAWDWSEIDCFVCGRGPGMYSGLRVSLTACRFFALPDQQCVYTLSSGVAVASRFFETEASDSVCVVGDARRNRLWYGMFERAAVGAVLNGEWNLTDWSFLSRAMRDASLPCISSNWATLAATEGYQTQPNVSWIERDIMPQAAVLGRVAGRMMKAGTATEALLPIYMHPPVEKR